MKAKRNVALTRKIVERLMHTVVMASETDATILDDMSASLVSLLKTVQKKAAKMGVCLSTVAYFQSENEEFSLENRVKGEKSHVYN